MSTVSYLEAVYRPMVPGSGQGRTTWFPSKRYPKSSAESSWIWPARPSGTSRYRSRSGSRTGSCTARPRSKGPIACSTISDATCIVSPSPITGSSRLTTVGLSSGIGRSAKQPAERCRWMGTSSSVVSCSTFCPAVSTRFATMACGLRPTGRCYAASEMSLPKTISICPRKTRPNHSHPNPLEAHGLVKVSCAHAVVKVCWSGLPPSHGRPERRRHLAAVDLPTSGDPDHAAPWLRFLVAVCLRLRSSSAAIGASGVSGVSHSPRVRPGSPLGEHAQPHLAAPSALLITCPTEDAPR